MSRNVFLEGESLIDISPNYRKIITWGITTDSAERRNFGNAERRTH
jgi:hypothetical protein